MMMMMPSVYEPQKHYWHQLQSRSSVVVVVAVVVPDRNVVEVVEDVLGGAGGGTDVVSRVPVVVRVLAFYGW